MASKSSSLLSAPNINSIQFSDSTVDLIRSIFRPAVLEPPVPTNTVVQAMPFTETSSMLLNPIRNMGPDIPIAEFCESFGLQPSVLKKLEENAYDHARHLRYVTLDNLMEMGFKLGEKAALQDAVERWSVSRD
jgi:hypothetical protein